MNISTFIRNHSSFCNFRIRHRDKTIIFKICEMSGSQVLRKCSTTTEEAGIIFIFEQEEQLMQKADI